MNLYEYEGKRLLKSGGIPVPESALLCTDDAPAPLPYPFVLKAQVMTGGRGKAGGIRLCANEAEYRRNAGEILRMQIKGHPVCGLLCEQAANVEKELYLSITLQGVSCPTLIFSAAGGMEIEEVAKTCPERLLRMELDPFTGIKDYQLKRLCAAAPEIDGAELSALVRKVYGIFMDTQALLVEINPLGLVDGHLVALDAKVVLDDHSKKMRSEMELLETGRSCLVNYSVGPKETTTITYVPLDGGNIGLISDGAGTGMLTLDLITERGGRVASFCELGGTTPAEVMYRAMEYTMTRNGPISAIMVVLIGGFNRMDDMADGITRYLRDHPVQVPIFTRMCGTMEEDGKRIMAKADLPTYDCLTDTVAALVGAANREG